MTLPDPTTFAGRRQWRWLALSRGWRMWLLAAQMYRLTLGRRTRVVMVTGSYGKTTTTRALRAVFGLAPDRWTELNTNCLGEIGWTLLRSHPLRRFNVVEAGAGSPGRLRRYAAAARPRVAVLTWIGREHLAAFGSLEALIEEKATVLRALPPDGTALLNRDDPRICAMASQTRGRVMWFGLDEGADVRASDIRSNWPHGTQFTLHAGGRSFEIATGLHGKGMVYPVLAAFAAGLDAGIPPDVLQRRLSGLTPTPGRLGIHSTPGDVVFIRDDYKATPDTFAPAVALLRQAPARRRWAVVGHLNNLPDADEAGAYAQIGRLLQSAVDEILVVGTVAAMYLAGMQPDTRSPRFQEAAGVLGAIRILKEQLHPGDVVLLKGYEDQGLARILFAFQGREVRCPVDWCRIRHQRCDDCRYLGRSDSTGGAVPMWRIGNPATSHSQTQ